MAKKATYPGTTKRGNTWSFYLNVNGKKVWRGGFATQKEAAEARAQASVERNKGRYIPRAKTTLEEYVTEAWLPSVDSRTRGKELKPTTAKQYRQKITYAVELLGSKPLQDIKPAHVEKMKASLLTRGLSPRTVHMAMMALSMTMSHAVDMGGLIHDNPVKRVTKPKVNTSIDADVRVMSVEQMRAVLATTEGTQWGAFLRLAFFTGARRGELLAVRWSDIDLDSKKMTIKRNIVEIDDGLLEQTPKGGKPRTIDLDDGTVSVLRTHRASQMSTRLELGEYWQGPESFDDGYVTCRPDGGRATPTAATSAWERYRDKASANQYRLHDCRHLHATMLLQAGVPLHVVAHRLGHKDPMVTATIYAHVLTEQAADAAAVFASAVGG